jgi:diguanylate cyclase (GGDEF)-like protein
MVGTIVEQTERLLDANVKLKVFASKDGLTGIANRRVFDDTYSRYWNLQLREHKSIGLILVDIDNFKGYNDANGHQSGDQCLKSVAEVMHQSLLRASNLLATYGGEGFVVILPNAVIEGATEVAEKVRKAVENLSIPHESSNVCNLSP